MQPDPPSVDAQRSRCIAVVVRGALYGLAVDEVQEVLAQRPLTRVFHAPDAIAGVMSLRGDVLAVLDLGVLLGGPPAPRALLPDARIIVVRETTGQRRRAGLVVDQLGGLREVPDGGLLEVPSTVSDAVRKLALGVIGSPPPCSVLSVPAMFDTEAVAAMSGAELES